ncbi:MAG: PQQ-dependent sugar dehydrogenase [Allosphingosinicella sp.]
MRVVPGLASLLLLTACGGGGGGGAPAPPANRAPQFTSAATVSVPENGGNAYQATATDPDGGSLTFTISGGADGARFAISAGGLLSFVSAPNFEASADADANNVYVVELRVSDGQASTTIIVQVTVTNDREGIRVRRVVTGLNQPLYVAPIPGDNRVFVLEKGGDVLLLDPATGTRVRFLSAADLRDPIGGGTFTSISTDGERGALGLAVAPNYQTNGEIFAYVTNADGDIEIRQFVRSSTGVGPAGGSVLVRIEHSQFNNHNGGWLGFGPDGHLYVATGDGGGAGDPQDNAQNTNSLLGKILRYMRNPDPFAGASPVFWIPATGNPFLGGGGAREVFAYGLRNPFRASFHNDALLIGDVGQDTVEEIDLLRTLDAGANFGWPFREGTRAFRGVAPAGLTVPVTEYFHGTGAREGRTVTGGYVYRGPAASLAGQYVFGDFSTGAIWTVPYATLQLGQTLAASRYERRNEDFTPDFGTINQIVSFGEDAAGNLYIVDFDGEVFIVGAS